MPKRTRTTPSNSCMCRTHRERRWTRSRMTRCSRVVSGRICRSSIRSVTTTDVSSSCTRWKRRSDVEDVKAGVYRHYKGPLYLVTGLAHDANAGELYDLDAVVEARHAWQSGVMHEI